MPKRLRSPLKVLVRSGFSDNTLIICKLTGTLASDLILFLSMKPVARLFIFCPISRDRTVSPHCSGKFSSCFEEALSPMALSRGVRPLNLSLKLLISAPNLPLPDSKVTPWELRTLGSRSPSLSNSTRTPLRPFLNATSTEPSVMILGASPSSKRTLSWTNRLPCSGLTPFCPGLVTTASGSARRDSSLWISETSSKTSLPFAVLPISSTLATSAGFKVSPGAAGAASRGLLRAPRTARPPRRAPLTPATAATSGASSAMIPLTPGSSLIPG